MASRSSLGSVWLSALVISASWTMAHDAHTVWAAEVSDTGASFEQRLNEMQKTLAALIAQMSGLEAKLNRTSDQLREEAIKSKNEFDEELRKLRDELSHIDADTVLESTPQPGENYQ